MGILEMLGKVREIKADADETLTDFDPKWLLGAIGAQLKKGALEALRANPKIDQLAERLGTDREKAAFLWAAFLQHLKEDF